MKKKRLAVIIFSIMRVSFLPAFLILIFTFSLKAGTSYAQADDKIISISADNTELKKVLNTITEQTGVKFTYSSDAIDVHRKITCNIQAQELKFFLTQVLIPLGIGYTVINDKQILLIKAPQRQTIDVSHNLTINGLVTNDKSEPMPNVSVLEKGTSNGTVTGPDGRFSLSVTNNTVVLIISYVGYQTQEIAVNGQRDIPVQMIEQNNQLDQVVVIGYGTTQRKNLTYSIAKVGEKDLKDVPVTSFEQALQGKVAGLQVTSPDGKPGGTAFLRIRGISSVNLASDPLYVIDGVVVNNLSGINTDDIASVEILKDASAQIYGVNGSNGVVIVTTKRGKAGKAKISFTNTVGISRISRKLSMLDKDQYLSLMNDVYSNAGIDVPAAITTGTLNNTNWQHETYGTGLFHNHELQFSGGNDKFNFFLSGGYQQEEGTISPADYKRYSIRSNIDYNLTSNFRIGSNTSLTRQVSQNIPYNSRANQGGVVLSALTSTPTSSTKPNPDGSYPYGNPTQALDNPLAVTRGITDMTYISKVISNVFAEWQLPFHLQLRTSLGVDYQQAKGESYIDPYITGNGRATNGQGSVSNNDELVWINTNTLTYKKEIVNHQNIEIMVGSEARKSKYSASSFTAKNFANDIVHTLGNASEIVSFGSRKSQWSFFSYFARGIYNYRDRYIFSGTFRADGSSRFPPQSRTAYFYSVSGAWRLINEAFMQNSSLFSDLKLRASYGISGNANIIDDFAYLATYGSGNNYPINDQTNAGSLITRLQNNNLQWEKTRQLNIGIDAAILHSRISLTADYYVRPSLDLLFSKPLPSNTGFGSALINIGKMQNKGIELSLTTQNITGKKFTWSTTLLYSANKNKMIALDGNNLIIFTQNAGGINLWSLAQQIGKPLSSFYGYVTKGVDPATGDMTFADISGPEGKPDGKITDDDRTIIGTALPKFTASISNTLNWKKFDLSFLFDGVFGNQVYNATRIETESMLDSKNASAAAQNRWTTPGQQTDMPRAVFGDPAANARISDRWIEKGDYVKLRFLTLGYTFKTNPSSLLSGARVYISGRNLVTFSNYSGYDPEISAAGGNNNAMGIDYGTFPPTRTFILGVTLNF